MDDSASRREVTPDVRATPDAGRATDRFGRPLTRRPLMIAIGGWPGWVVVGGATLLTVIAAVLGVSVTLPAWARYRPGNRSTGTSIGSPPRTTIVAARSPQRSRWEPPNASSA